MRPARLTLTNSAYALDGGTIVLMATDEAGHEHTVRLVQRSRPSPCSSGWRPGRLYFDEELVPIRSELEAGLVSLLRSAEVRCGEVPGHGERIQLSPNAAIFGDDIREVLTHGPVDIIRSLAARVVEFVSSDAYLLFAERVEQAADQTRYDVWVACDAATFNTAVVATKRLMGVAMREAKEVVEQGRPVAQGVSATDVVEWAGRYREAGLGVRVSPAFRWPLP